MFKAGDIPLHVDPTLPEGTMLMVKPGLYTSEMRVEGGKIFLDMEIVRLPEIMVVVRGIEK